MTEKFNFQVNLRGIIDLLSGHLYSSPEVFIRELLQNANDAIVARRKREPDHVGRIDVEVTPGPENGLPTLAIFDDGIGLTIPEIHQFLATIGQSSKRSQIDRDSYIGQFGIGLLSAFMVCDEIVLITKSAEPGSSTVKWLGRSDGSYEIAELNQEMQTGSQVFIRCKPGCQEFFEHEFILQATKNYASFLPIPINVGDSTNSQRINRVAPWTNNHESERVRVETQLNFAYSEWGKNYLTAIPLESEHGGVSGVAYITAESSHAAPRRSDTVYLKGMLVSHQADELLPEWAFFVRCILNVTDLRPTASRESFHDDQYLDETRAHLGQIIKDWLIDLSETAPQKLHQIIALHYRPIKALALDDETIFRLFVKWLPFETTYGMMTLEEIIAKSEVIRYVDTVDQFRQVSSVALSQSICLVNAGHTYESDLIRRLSEVFPELETEKVEIDQLVQEFGELSLDERSQVMNFIKVADATLLPFRCKVDIRKFHPVQLPVLYTSSEQANFQRSVEKSQEAADDLFSGLMDAVQSESFEATWPSLCFNFNNPLVGQVSALSDAKLIQRTVEMLYIHALLLGHHPLRAEEFKLLNSCILNLIELVVDQGEQHGE